MATCAATHAIPKEWIPHLDKEWVTLWNEHGCHQYRADEVSVDQYRENPKAYSFTYAAWEGPKVFHEEEFDVPVSRPAGIVKVRVYSPAGKGPFPVHFNYHGGGWVLGGLQSEAAWCRSICNDVGIKVIDVDYRMAPEFPFPTAIYDSWEVVQWARQSAAAKLNIKADSVSIGGLSAGGHMTAVMSHIAKRENVDLKLALMVVPSTDLRWSIGEEPMRSEIAKKYPSVAMVEHNPWGPRSRMDWFMDHWIPKDTELRRSALSNWMASPILAESFEGMPRTHIVTAEYDLSRDESHKYGELLKAAGNDVTVKCYAGMPHAFGHYNHPERGLKQSHQYIRDTGDIIRNSHGLSS